MHIQESDSNEAHNSLVLFTGATGRRSSCHRRKCIRGSFELVEDIP